jgi:hypothetical protein
MTIDHGSGRSWQPDEVRALLRARGYDIDHADTRYGDYSVSARRERGGLAQMFVVDSGGRFRAELAVDAGETGRTSSIGAVPVVIVALTRRLLTVTGSLQNWSHLPSVLSQLDTFV